MTYRLIIVRLRQACLVFYRTARIRRSTILALCCIAGCTSGKPKPAESVDADVVPQYAFHELGGQTTILPAYENGESGRAYSIVESLGGGCGVLDFDRDGRWDIWLPGGGLLDGAAETITGLPSALFRSLSPGGEFVDASAGARIDALDYYTHGCSVADVDSDGFPDVLVSGYGGLQFFHNQGDGTFRECAQSIGLTDRQWSTSTGFADFNGDGHVDLYVTHYVDWSWENNPRCRSAPPDPLEDVCTPSRFTGLNDTLYLSNGDGTFVDASETVGLVPEGKGLGVIIADLDHDADVDIYVANDTTENFLYLNDSQAQFEEVGLVSGTSLDHRGTPNGSMGLAVLDYDGDLLPDIWVTNYENETFSMYRNMQHGNFLCVTESTGITALGTLYVGFGTSAADIDLDGDEDIIVSNGHVQQHPGSSTVAQQALLLLNDGRGRLIRKQLPSSEYFSTQHRGRAVVSVDFNHDGMLDLLFRHVASPPAILLNQSERQGNWLTMQLVGKTSNRDAIGAWVELKAGDRSLIRHVVGGGGYLSQAPYTLHWGLADAETASASVHWPDGQVQEVDALTVNNSHLVIQP